MDFDDDNYSTDSSEARERDAKKAIVEVVEEEETVPVPEYSEDELKKLLLYVQQIVTCYDLNEEDISESFTESTTKWFMDVLETTLFVYFDQGFLSAGPTCPINPVSQLTYFIRDDPGHVFSIDKFHDEVTFGNFHENVEETILCLMNNIYAPLILNDKRWDDNVKMKLFNDLHSFMAHLTDVNSKIGSMVILYVPNEGHNLSVEEAVLNKPLVKRYENVVIYWIAQIRLCLNDMDNFQSFELACPRDEFDFWVYKFEVLSGIEEQIRHRNIEHILNILDKSQSLFIAKFRTLREELIKEIERSKSNASYLKLLVEPCMELESSEYPTNVPAKLPKIIYLIRVISLNSEYYKNKRNTERLFSYLSNEIINYCKSKIDIPKILNGQPRFGIKICDMSIDCCIAYKLIFRRVLERLQTEDFRKTWVFDETKIFNQIEIFIKRLSDIMEICETIIVFGRVDETVEIPPLTFGCYNAKEYTMTCQDMEEKFEAALSDIKTSCSMILNVHDKNWYQVISTFQKLIRSLEEVVQNLLVNVFISINNVEEALDVLTTLHNFSKRKSLQGEYIVKVEEMWNMFESEVLTANKDITRLDKEYLGCMPQFSGKSTILTIKMRKCERLKDLLINAHYLPKVPMAEEKMKMYERTMENIRKKIEDYNNEWSSQISSQPINYLTRFLVNRSPTHGGLLECNIDRNIMPIFEEAKYFDFIDLPLPAVLIQTYPKAKKIINVFNKVASVVLLHNRILSSLSDKERLLFKEHIKAMDKKLAPGMFKLTYNDEMTDAYITECLKHLDELQHFVDIYKTINMVNVRSFEKISNGLMLNINIRAIGTLEQFKRKFKESRNDSVVTIGQIYKKVIEYILVIYEGFERQLTNEVAQKWMKYIHKIDALAEYAIINCAKNTLIGVFNLLNGKNDMKPEPFITLDITLKERKIQFEPSLESVAKTMNLIYRDIIKSISIFPRLSDKFELPYSPEIKKFYEVINEDKECQKYLLRINDVIEENLEKTSDYIYTWYHFRSIWDIDIDRFMEKYQEKGLELKEFESSMMKYYDVANQVMMQDNSVTITYVTYNCSRLKECVLDYIAGWKKSYKQTLCAATLKKLEKHNSALTTRINTLNEQPTTYEELEASMQLHEKSMKELKERLADMDDIREYYSFLEKYDIDIPSTIKRNFEMMPSNWAWYNEQLREVDDNLYSQKEQFKMGLMTSTTKLKTEIEEMVEKIDEEFSSSSEITAKEHMQILSKFFAQIYEFEQRKEKLNERVAQFSLPEIVLDLIEPLKNKLKIVNEVWKLIKEWETILNENQYTLLWKADLDYFENLLTEFSQRFEKTVERHMDRQWEFLLQNKKCVEDFKKTLPLFRCLQNRAIKQRHWDQIREVVQQSFDPDSAGFTLKAIVQMKMLNFTEKIEKISNSASKELQIEENIKKIVNAWEKLKFDIVPYKVRNLKIQSVDDCLKAIEEHSNLIRSMKIETIPDAYETVVNDWEEKLSSMSEVLENLLQVQKKWLLLDALFRKKEIRRGFKQEADSFRGVSSEFQEMLHKMKSEPTAIEAVSYIHPVKLSMEIGIQLTVLEKIQRSLQVHLEKN